jgi:hypothetical protein
MFCAVRRENYNLILTTSSTVHFSVAGMQLTEQPTRNEKRANTNGGKKRAK